MEIKLKPIGAQVVVVFGASSGIGRITALEFARRGAKLIVSARSEDGLKSLVEEIREIGGEAFYVVADAADFQQVKTVADKAVELFGRIDTWVHSAGTLIFARVEQTEPEEFQRLIEVNLLGQIHGAKAALPYLKKNGGALIHLSSVESYRTVPFQSAYGASKHGINGFLKALHVELKHDEIPVSVTQILPHAINTPIYDKGRNKMPFKARPIPPIYHPQIVADAILYAAENPIAELIAGGAGAVAIMTERISPAISEWFAKKLGFVAQNTSEENPGIYEGNLFEPVSGMDTVEGSFSDEQIGRDPYTYVKTHPKVKTGLLAAGGIIGGLLAWRALKRK